MSSGTFAILMIINGTGVVTSYSANQLGANEQPSKRQVAGGSRVAAEMLAALLVAHLVFLYVISYESPPLFNLIILLQRSLPPDFLSVPSIVGNSIADVPLIVAERLGIGLAYAIIWLGMIIWLWRRGGWLVPVLVLAAGAWEAYWRVRILQFQADSGQVQSWLVLFGLLCAAVTILAGLIGIIAAASRRR